MLMVKKKKKKDKLKSRISDYFKEQKFLLNKDLNTVKIHLVVHVFSDFSNNTPHQISQSQSASFTCGYRPGLLPTGFLTKCLHLSAAEGVSVPTLHTHNPYTVSAFFYAKLLCKPLACSFKST